MGYKKTHTHSEHIHIYGGKRDFSYGYECILLKSHLSFCSHYAVNREKLSMEFILLVSCYNKTL